MTPYRLFLAALTALAFALPAPAGCPSCGGGGSRGGFGGPPPMMGPPPPNFAPRSQASTGGYAVQAFADDPDQIAVLRDGKQIGGVRFSTGTWLAYDAATRTWVTPASKGKAPRPCDCQDGSCPGNGCRPGGPDCPCRQNSTPFRNFGEDTSRVTQGCTTINGRPVTQAQALAAVRGGSLPDDANRPFLTVIGTEAECSQVSTDLASNPALASFRDKIRYQTYQPDDWAVKGVGFAPGHPAVYLQNAAGTVLHRQDSYAGPEALALALRKADPAYDPVKDPDLTKPSLLPFALPDWLTTAPEIIIPGAIVLGLLAVTLVRGGKRFAA